MADTSASITSTQYSGVHANMQSIASLACSASESQTRNRIMRAKLWPNSVASNTVKEIEDTNGIISLLGKGKVLRLLLKVTGSHLSGGKKGLPHFTCSVYSYSFSSSPAFVFHFCTVTKTRTYLSKVWLNIGLGGGQEKLRSFLTSPTGIINTKLAD